jgi:preprotein translocase subunit SecY
VSSSILRVLRAVFWVGAPICVVVIAASSLSKSAWGWLSWTTGVSLLVVL